MTDNHKLLFRLAELMLQHEQHILPVDLLFDDGQIGDFVKSIQIDSPYQQMLLEGVLTESVRDEKLYVGFTVEGYFHYVLGEVIYSKSEEKSAEYLKEIIEHNKLNGAKEGVEQCLIRDVQNGDLNRLIYLIDADEKFNNICVYPILISFKEQLFKTDKSNQVDLISILFSETTNNDFKVLFNTINLAKKLNLIKLANEITVCLINFLGFKSNESVVFIAKTLEFLTDNKLRKKTVDKIRTWMASNKSYGMTLLELNSGIATTYFELNMIDEALIYYKKCLKYEQEYLVKNHVFTSTSYNQIGLLMLKKQKCKAALNYFKKSLNIKTSILPNSSTETTNTMHNIALAYQYQSNFKKCIKHYEMVLERRLKYEGKTSLGAGITLSNLGIAYIQSDIKSTQGENLIKEAINLNNILLGNPNTKNTSIYRWLAFTEWQKENCDLKKIEQILSETLKNNIILSGKHDLTTAYCYDDLFNFYLHSNKLSKAENNGRKALAIYRKILGQRHIHTKNLLIKIEEIKAKQ